MMLLLLAVPLQGSRRSSLAVQDDEEADTAFQGTPAPAGGDDEEAPTSFMGNAGATGGDQGGIDLVSDDDEGTTIFQANEGSAVVEEERTRNPEADVKSVFEIRTKLKFTSNAKTLANPEMIERILDDIKSQQEQLPGLNFVFCLHVGTTAEERITQTRPGFMEGRTESVKDALQPNGAIPGVNGLIADEFQHFETERFAGLVMKAFGGEEAPECQQDDLTPPGGDDED